MINLNKISNKEWWFLIIINFVLIYGIYIIYLIYNADRLLMLILTAPFIFFLKLSFKFTKTKNGKKVNKRTMVFALLIGLFIIHIINILIQYLL